MPKLHAADTAPQSCDYHHDCHPCRRPRYLKSAVCCHRVSCLARLRASGAASCWHVAPVPTAPVKTASVRMWRPRATNPMLHNHIRRLRMRRHDREMSSLSSLSPCLPASLSPCLPSPCLPSPCLSSLGYNYHRPFTRPASHRCAASGLTRPASHVLEVRRLHDHRLRHRIRVTSGARGWLDADPRPRDGTNLGLASLAIVVRHLWD